MRVFYEFFLKHSILGQSSVTSLLCSRYTVSSMVLKTGSDRSVRPVWPSPGYQSGPVRPFEPGPFKPEPDRRNYGRTDESDDPTGFWWTERLSSPIQRFISPARRRRPALPPTRFFPLFGAKTLPSSSPFALPHLDFFPFRFQRPATLPFSPLRHPHIDFSIFRSPKTLPFCRPFWPPRFLTFFISYLGRPFQFFLLHQHYYLFYFIFIIFLLPDF